MPLNPASLESALLSLFRGQHVHPSEASGRFPASQLEAGQVWAKIYRNYAADATSCQTQNPTSVSLDAAELALAAALPAAFSAATPADCAAILATALTTFWLSPPVLFDAGGAVTGVTGTAVLSGALITQWANNITNSVTAEAAAAQHASLFDAFTKTVVVSHPAVPCAAPVV